MISLDRNEETRHTNTKPKCWLSPPGPCSDHAGLFLCLEGGRHFGDRGASHVRVRLPGLWGLALSAGLPQAAVWAWLVFC